MECGATLSTAETRPGRLKLSILTETYPPEINGVANTMRYLVEGLADLGHQVQLVRPRQASDPKRPAAGPLDVALVPGLPIPGYRGLRFGLPVYWRLRRLWCRSRPDLVYIATQGPLGYAALSAACALGIPSVTGFHTQFHQYSQHYGLGILSHKIAETLRHFHNRSDATLVPTEELQEELADAGFQNLHVLGRGVDIQRFSPGWRDPALRASWGCDPHALAVLYVGRIAAEKNLDLLRDAFLALHQEIPSARLVLVGDGPALAHLRRDLPDAHFAGAQVGEALSAHYASADLFLFPSLTETFGNVVTEAMASGLGVIAFDYAAAHAHIRSGRNGVAVRLDDRAGFIAAACALASDRRALRLMGQAARVSAEGISWERVLGHVEALLFTVIKQRSPTEDRHAALARAPQ